MGLETDFVFADGETRTNLKILDPAAYTTTDINEPGLVVSTKILDDLLHRLLQRIAPGDIAVLSGSLPQGAPADTYALWTEALSKKGVKVFLDAEGEPLKMGLTAAPYLIKPNELEFSDLISRTLGSPEPAVQAANNPESHRQAAKVPGSNRQAAKAPGPISQMPEAPGLPDQARKTPPELAAAACSLMQLYPVQKLVISIGDAGALFVTARETIYAEGLKVPVGNTAGAGDSVVAALAVAEERGFSLNETVSLSMATGAANVMCSGTQAAEADVIYDLTAKVVSHRLS